MLIGSYRHQVDAKGRVAVPSSLRKDLPLGSVIAKGMEGRLVIRPPEEWEKVAGHFELRSDTTKAERDFMRRLYASAREVELDAQGRLLLDADHRRWAAITDRALFVGLGNCVEVVGEEIWDGEEAGFDQAAYTALGDSVSVRAGNPPAGSPSPA